MHSIAGPPARNGPGIIARPETVAKIIVGGEAFPILWPTICPELFRENCSILRSNGDDRLVEHRCRRARTTTGANGRPIANTQLYILDNSLHPVPIGVMGELFIGGDGVAAGYHNRPQLTAERFVDDPFSSERGRLLPQGDIARYLPDGNIECLGRADHQVKIRGHRIELGEIETVLQQYRGVGEAVSRSERPAGRPAADRLCRLHPGQALTEDELRRYLELKLPREMVLAAVLMLDALPRTPNGEPDRRALPAPDYVPQQTERGFVAPRDPAEKELAAIWERILRVSPIGARDNFFELGGHSLLAVSLFAHIEKAFGKTLPLAILFTSPTIEQLARILQRDEPSVPWSALVPIQPHGAKPPLFFMHSGGGHVLGVLRFGSESWAGPAVLRVAIGNVERISHDTEAIR